MHIVHVTPYYAPAYAFGGVPRAVEGMVLASVRRGHTVTVLTTDALSPGERSPQTSAARDGVQMIRCRNLWLRGHANVSTPRGLHAAATRIFPTADVVHCHEFRTTENLIVTPIATRSNTPLVLSPHGTLPHSTGRSLLKSIWDRAISPAMAKRFDAVVSLTQHEHTEAQTLWQQFSAVSKQVVIPNGIDMAEFTNLPRPSRFREQFGLGNAHVILFMGRLHPRKGADVLARAMHHVQTPNVKLLIAGPNAGLGTTLQQLASEDDRIIIAGYLDGEARLAAYAAADVFALPAIGEGLPMAVLEAMACETPVVVSPGCHLAEVTAYGAGIEVNVDERAIAQAIDLLLSSPKQLTEMGQAARSLVEQRFTWDGVAQQLEQLYESVCLTGETVVEQPN